VGGRPYHLGVRPAHSPSMNTLPFLTSLQHKHSRKPLVGVWTREGPKPTSEYVMHAP
jgi:hypothetical protein